ncbi:MAG TPA: hypothetical protein VIL01_00045 [Thermomicrobiales bacterium]
MTGKEAFTEEEWATLVEVPVLTMLCASFAESDRRLGYLREIAAGSQAITRAVESYPDNELIAAVAWAMEDEEMGRRFAERMQGLTAEEMTERLFARCHEAMAILVDKASEKEIKEYATWILDIGEEVALATAKGGFLGIGGQAVTSEERTFLQRLADALTAIARSDAESNAAPE